MIESDYKSLLYAVSPYISAGDCFCDLKKIAMRGGVQKRTGPGQTTRVHCMQPRLTFLQRTVFTTWRRSLCAAGFRKGPDQTTRVYCTQPRLTFLRRTIFTTRRRLLCAAGLRKGSNRTTRVYCTQPRLTFLQETVSTTRKRRRRKLQCVWAASKAWSSCILSSFLKAQPILLYYPCVVKSPYPCIWRENTSYIV